MFVCLCVSLSETITCLIKWKQTFNFFKAQNQQTKLKKKLMAKLIRIRFVSVVTVKPSGSIFIITAVF